MISLIKSKLGVPLSEDLVVSGVGQADDVCLLSNDLFSLNNLLQLTLNYCQQFHIELRADKTKLLMISPRNNNTLTFSNPLTIYDQNIADQAEHVGFVRSPYGNLTHLLHRICDHKKSKAALWSTGIARRNSGNVAAALRLNSIWLIFTRTGTPLEIFRWFPQIVFTLLTSVRPINVGFSNRFFC